MDFFFGSFMLLSLIMLNYYFNFFLFFLLITLQTREKEKKRRERERALHYCKEREGTDYIIVSQWLIGEVFFVVSRNLCSKGIAKETCSYHNLNFPSLFLSRLRVFFFYDIDWFKGNLGVLNNVVLVILFVFFRKYVWVKKYMKICIILFKYWKLLF